METQQAALSLFLNRMNDIRNMYLYAIESSSIAVLKELVDRQELQHMAIISDHDIQYMQWVVKKMPVQNCPVANRGFLSFLIQLKGLIEERVMRYIDDWDNELTEMMESTWVTAFLMYGNTEDAKSYIKAKMSAFAEDQRFKDIINNSYIKAKRKWAHQNHPG